MITMATPRPTRAQSSPAAEIKDLYLNATPRSVARTLRPQSNC
jgi:hypothetical protein